ncbi:hypothetical protein HON71_00180 [Candidatus Woesearchaeota archaeon]|nr:hypothetical protein [Candidatus Woesearchaeota archaeon]MBT5342625.1 hypothetical protein [Candidatus Woesearchaeota archaeon]
MGKIISNNKKRNLLPFIKDNLGNLSQREIAKKLNIGKTTINRWAEELGFKHKKHTVNDKFFDTLTEESVYLLGYIYADGNISWNPKKGYQTLTITASAKDKDHLERMRKVLSSTKPLLFSQKTNSYRLIANNKNLSKRLMMLGVFPKKSLIVQFPDFLPDKYLKHFIRGIIDGDGNVRYVERKKSPYFEITIASGSEDFCKSFVKATHNFTKIPCNIRKLKGNTFILQYSCTRGEKLADFIYSQSNIFLERKYLAYKKFLEERKK